MNEKELRERFAAREMESQMEFDRMMAAINDEQTRHNHPLLDRDREILVQRERITLQIQALRQQDSVLKMERVELEQQRKDANRVFHDLKHRLVMMNPIERFARPVEAVAESE